MMDVIKEKKTSVGLKQVAKCVNVFFQFFVICRAKCCINTVSLPSFYTDRLLLLNTVALYDNIFSSLLSSDNKEDKTVLYSSRGTLLCRSCSTNWEKVQI